MKTLPNEARAACAVCAQGLFTGRVWFAFALLSLLAVLLATNLSCSAAAHRPGLFIAAFGVGVWVAVLAARVEWDARLFDRLARGEITDLSALDEGLRQVVPRSAKKAGRPLASRMAGARRLYVGLVSASLCLVLLALVALIQRPS